MQCQNINRHMKTAHNKTLQYSAICCEQVTGLYMVRKSQRGGINYPCHVQKIINADGSNKMECGVVTCREEMLIAARSGMQARKCAHLLKANNAHFPKNVDLTDDQLQQLSFNGKRKVLSNETIDKCLNKKCEADSFSKPAVVEWDDNNHIQCSIYDGNYMNILVLSRYIVTYNKLTGKLDCRCGARKYLCLHKAMCLWYLYQVGKIKNPGHQQTEDTDDPEVDISFENITDNSFAIYPSDSQTALLRMIEYMQNTKKLPYTEPQK
eukprot:gene20974-23031_t